LCNLPEKTKQFFGRTEELSVVKRQIQIANDGRKGIIVHGLPGAGKTQLVLEYISQERDHYSAILWIDAVSEVSIERSFDDCKDSICLEYVSFQDRVSHKSRSVVRKWLQTPIHSGWLLVVDGMDDLNKDLREFCAGLCLGAICVTSTNRGARDVFHFEQIMLETLDLVASQSLLLWRAYGADQDHGKNRE
jgi:hypothetical protein